jgi:hypothetical protein
LISSRLITSHRFSWNITLKYAFKLVVVPEKFYDLSNVRIAILVDNSDSMFRPMIKEGYEEYGRNCREVDGYQVCEYPDWVPRYPPAIDEVVPAVREVLANLPQSVKVSLFLYSSDVVPLARDVSPSTAVEFLNRIQAGQAWTSTYTAIWAAQDADLIIVVTDGTPTDRPREVKLKGKLILIGVGGNYNEGVLRRIADMYNGVLIAAKSGQIAQAIKDAVPERIAAKDVIVQFSSPLGKVNLVNYSTNPINLGTLERAVSIYGWVEVPPGYSGEVLTAHVSYVDPRSGERRAMTLRGELTKANDPNQFLSGVNNDVIAELEWYDRLRQVSSGNVEQTLKLLREVAERTKRIDLIERTKKLEAMKGDTKALESQVTKTLRMQEGK